MASRKLLLPGLLVVGAVAGVALFGVGGRATANDPAPAAEASEGRLEIPYDRLAHHIVTALHVTPGERVILRYDPATLGPLEPIVRKALLDKGAKVETLNYGPVENFEKKLAETDIYIWLPAGPQAQTLPEQRAVLVRWLDEGRGRQIHFHWVGGTVDPDGRGGVHSEAFDRVYVDALEIDYAKLSATQDRAIAKLRSGEVRVTTPAGTDIRFQVGDRPFNKQDGNAAKARTDQAKTRVDREIELPSGVLRVAPIESTAQGVIVVPKARLLDEAIATDIRLEFVNGKITKATAREGEAALQAYLQSSPTLTSFRELGIGFNPKLVRPAGSPYLPYYGYGDAVVRLSIGDNTELAGAIRGGASRWLFFPDTTLTVGGEPVIENGRLTAAYRY